MPKSLATSETRYGAMRRLVSKGLKSGPHKVLKRILNLGRTGTLTDEMVRLNHAEARIHDVDPAIHPGDFMYWFCCHHPRLDGRGGHPVLLLGRRPVGRNSGEHPWRARTASDGSPRQTPGVCLGLWLRHAAHQEKPRL